MTIPDLPVDLIGLCAFLAVIAGQVITARISARRADERQSAAEERHSEAQEVLERVRHQVENSHSTNLRDDMDRLERKLEELGERTALGLQELRVITKTNRDEFARFRLDGYKAIARNEEIISKYHPEDALK